MLKMCKTRTVMRHWFLSILINKNSYFLFYINFIHNQVVQISVQCMVMAGEWTWRQDLQRRAQILQPGGWNVHRIHDGRHQGHSFDGISRGQAACRRCYCCLWAWCKQLNIVLANKFINVIIIKGYSQNVPLTKTYPRWEVKT